MSSGDLIRDLRVNKWVIIPFILSTANFLYQRSQGISWDYAVYVLNAKYLFAGGSYFEWLRPPLAPFILGVLSVFGWSIAEYLYIVFVSVLFLYSTIKLSMKWRTEPLIMYSLLLTPFILTYGLVIGTELLFLSMIMLSLAYVGGKKCGLFMGLAALTRYNSLIYLPLLLLKKSPKEVLLSLILVFLVFLPWLAYNEVAAGDPLASIADAYALNMKYRYEYLPAFSFNLFDALSVTGYLLPFMFLGGFLKYMRKKSVDETDAVLLLLTALTLFSYVRIPVKDARYLIALSLPLAYYSSIALRPLLRKKILPCLLVALNIALALSNPYPLATPDFKKDASKSEGCMLQSNEWAYLNYYGIPCEPYPRKGGVAEEISKGKRILLYKYEIEPAYARDEAFLKTFPVIDETDDYVLLGNTSLCAQEARLDKAYIGALQERGINATSINVFLT